MSKNQIWRIMRHVAVIGTLATFVGFLITNGASMLKRAFQEETAIDRVVYLAEGQGVVVATGETVTLLILADIVLSLDPNSSPYLKAEAGIYDLGIGRLGDERDSTRKIKFEAESLLRIGHVYALKCSNAQGRALVRVEAYDSLRKRARLNIRFAK